MEKNINRKNRTNNGAAAGTNQESIRPFTAPVSDEPMPAITVETSSATSSENTIIKKEETTMNKKTTQKNSKPQSASHKLEKTAIPGTISMMNESQYEQYMWMDNAILQISPDIQRRLDPMKVAEIVRTFSPLVVNPIKVSLRDGKYYIFDGMHTRTALCIINGKDNFPVLCRVYHGLTKEDESRLFATQFGTSTPVPLAYRLRALAVAKDPTVLDFLDTTRGCGFAITLGSNVASHGWIAATCTAFKVYEDLSREKYSRMLKLLHRTWAGENWSVSQYMLRGMARFMKMYDFQDAAFVKAFRGVTRKEVIHEAERFPGMTWDGAVATALGEIFDRNSSSMLYRIR